MSEEIQALKTRLLKYSRQNGECIESTYKARTQTGYALVKYKGSTRGAHRISWMVHKGEIPEGLYICHHCDNRRCIAPDHLFLGTAKENMQDAAKKGRLEHVKLFAPKGEKNHNSKLDDDKVRSIRKEIQEGIRCTVIARKYGVGSSLIYQIRDGKSWKHLL